jgi:hypothetical protein
MSDLKAKRTIQDELRRILSVRRNPALQFGSAEDRMLLGAQVALQWVLHHGEPAPCGYSIREGPVARVTDGDRGGVGDR